MKYLIPCMLLSIILLVSCDLNNPHGNNGKDEIPAKIETKEFILQPDGSYLFQTNDKQLVGPKGSTQIIYNSTEKAYGPFDYKVKLCKTSGSILGGFGVIFQRQVINNVLYFWIVNIDSKGYYYVSKIVDDLSDKVDGFEYNVFNWLNSNSPTLPGLHDYQGAENTLRITFDGVSDYKLYANESTEYFASFSDNGSDYGATLLGGCFGVDAVVNVDENFPDIPVSVSYKIISPSFSLPTLQPNILYMSRMIGVR